MFSQTAQRKQTSWHYETLQSERDEKERLPLRVWKPCLQTLHTSPWQEWHAYAIGCCFNCLVATDVILHRQDSLLKQRHCAIALWYPLWWNMSACIGSSKLGCPHRYDPCYLDTKRIPKEKSRPPIDRTGLHFCTTHHPPMTTCLADKQVLMLLCNKRKRWWCASKQSNILKVVARSGLKLVQ